MTTGTQITWDDSVLPFQLDRSDIRGRVARLDGVLGEVLKQHHYPAQIEALVAEATLLTALIGQTIKLRWKLSLQIRGKGPARLIATDYYGPSADGEPGRIRAYASFDMDRLDPDASPFSQIGEGYLAMMLDQGEGTVPYQGFTPIAGSSISDCAETYFAQSEQLPTRFAVTFGKSQLPGQAAHWRAGGVMLQHMPKIAGTVAAEAGSGEGGLLTHVDILAGHEAENWNRSCVGIGPITYYSRRADLSVGYLNPSTDSQLVARPPAGERAFLSLHCTRPFCCEASLQKSHGNVPWGSGGGGRLSGRLPPGHPRRRGVR